MTGVDIVAAGLDHAPIVAALHAATIGGPATDAAPAEGWSAVWVAKLLTLPGTLALLAVAPGDASEPIGFALCLAAGEALDLAAIGVLPERRRAGIGRRLLAACEDGAREAGVRRLMLEVADGNAAALALYARCGFAETGRRRHYYPARDDAGARDALVLSKEL